MPFRFTVRVSPRSAGAVLVAVSMLPGCADLVARDDYSYYRPPPPDLGLVEPVVLADLSTAEPVSVDEAAAQFSEQATAVEAPSDEIKLELVQVRTAALANNLDLKVELVDPAIAAAAIREEEAIFEPLLSAAASHTSTNRETSLAGGVVNVKSTAIDAGVEIPLRTGGTVNVNFLLDKEDDDAFVASSETVKQGIVNPVYDSGLRFSISHPLLRNAGIRTNTHLIRVARYQRDIEEARTRLAVINILAEADRAYWRLYAATGELKVRQEQYERAKLQLAQARKRVAAGATAEVEIMRAKAGVANRIEAIIVTDTALRQRERDVKRIMNRGDLDLHSPVALIPSTQPNPLGIELDPVELEKRALANRMELLEIELQLAIDASRVDVDRNAVLPLISLESSYTLNGFGASYDNALRGSVDSSFADYFIGLNAEIPLGNAAAKSRLRRALLQRIQRLATREQRRLTIRQEVRDALDQLQQAWQRILAARQEVVLAGVTYKAEQRQFEVGSRTSVEVLEAADFLAEAQSREVRALAAYEVAQIDIALATGTLLGHDGVVWTQLSVD